VSGTSSRPVVSHRGTTTTIDAGLRVTLPRVVTATASEARAVLRGTWPGQELPRLLATVVLLP